MIQDPKVGRHALRLFVHVRATHEDWDTHTFTAARRVLADGITVPLSTLDVALAQLKAAGAITWEQQKDATGNLTESLYTILVDGPTRGGVDRKTGVGGKPKTGVRAAPKNRSRTAPGNRSARFVQRSSLVQNDQTQDPPAARAGAPADAEAPEKPEADA